MAAAPLASNGSPSSPGSQCGATARGTRHSPRVDPRGPPLTAVSRATGSTERSQGRPLPINLSAQNDGHEIGRYGRPSNIAPRDSNGTIGGADVGAATLYALDPRYKRCASGDPVEGLHVPAPFALQTTKG
jgi:hypothetical protein